MNDSKTWEQLAELIRAKERDSIGLFMEEVGVTIRRWLVNRGAAPSDAEDAATTAIEDAILAIDQFTNRGAGSLFAWVSKIAWNCYLGQLRRRFTLLSEQELSNIPSHTDEFASNNAATTSLDSLAQIVRSALQTLPVDDRELVLARAENSGLTFKELGDRIGLSEGATRIRFHRIKTNLAKTLIDKPRVIEWLHNADVKGTENE